MAAKSARVAEVRAEDLLIELLRSQGWDTRRPPAGELLRQHEYKDYPALAEILRGVSKSGKGDGRPEAFLINRETLQPLAVIEVKPDAESLNKAVREVTEVYGRASIDAGYTPLAIALAGVDEDNFKLRVLKWTGSAWTPVTYDGDPITWIPNLSDIERLIPPSAPSELRPSVPPAEVLAARADEINRLLRESGIKDEFRPAAVAAIMLALWFSKGEIRRDARHILRDINEACRDAFIKAGKADLAKSLRVDEANDQLARHARRIAVILERLNVHVLTAEHDYLGQLYETFFRYTGGNTIGQYFTPRHVAEMMADMTDVSPTDVVLDCACGTGGFLIAAMNRILTQKKLSRSQLGALVKKKLIGIDKEPVTASLCVANMILRGDGTTGVHRADCFTWPEFPIGKATVALLNPPFPHKKTDTPSEKFVERSLEGLQQGGRLAVLVPTSLLVKKDRQSWRDNLKRKHTINGIISFERELWHPYADSVASVLLMTKGVPHRANRQVYFAKVKNDGFRVIKQVRTPVPGSQIPAVEKAYHNKETIGGLCGWAELGDDWGPGLYVPANKLSDEEVVQEVYYLTRSRSAATVAYAHRLVEMRADIDAGKMEVESIRERRRLGRVPISDATIGGYFDVVYGQKDLHNKRDLRPGSSLIISSQGTNNGWYGFYDFGKLLAPPFVTVPSTGTIGHALVQEWPCGVTDDCLILVPKVGATVEHLYIAAAVIRSERWRFNYGMKATPDRISRYPLPLGDGLLRDVRTLIDAANNIENLALEAAEDELDTRIARQRLSEEKIISGTALIERLARLET